MSKAKFLIITLFFLNFFLVSNTFGDCDNKYCFRTKINTSSKSLELHKFATYKYIFFRIYTIALYKSYEDNITEIEDIDSMKALTLYFHRDIDKELLIKGAKDVLRDNPKVNYKEYQKELKILNSSYKDVKEGETITLLHEPNVGLSLIYKDDVMAKVLNPKFSNDYLGIWLSKWPVSNHLRQKLL